MRQARLTSRLNVHKFPFLELSPDNAQWLSTWGMATIRYKLGHLLEIARLSWFSGLIVGHSSLFEDRKTVLLSRHWVRQQILDRPGRKPDVPASLLIEKKRTSDGLVAVAAN